MKTDTFRMVAKTFQGLEDVLRDELIDLGAENVEIGNRMVSFEGDNSILYKANLCCRTALRILKPIVMFNAANTDELYDYLRDLDWEEFMSAKSTFSVDSTVYGDDFSHSKFVTYRVKDAIVDHFRDKDGERPSIRLEGADIQLNVHIAGDRVTVSLDSSGEPLYKRGYRVAQTDAPINEVLAAGIILKTGWRGHSDFLDPMCGSGTFLIEAALIAANINPGIYRENFAFEKWNDFDKDLFEEIYNDDSEEKDFNYKIFGGDIDPEAISVARKNIKSAHVEEMIDLSCQPLTEWQADTAEGIIITNPPYGERLRPMNLNNLYREIGSTLKNNFQGWHAWIIGYQDEQMKEIGLKPSVKIPLYNGNLECTLREYVMFDGAYSQFRAEGGSVASEAAEKRKAEGPRKVRHISDDDWKKESKRFNRDHGMKDKPHSHQKGRNERDDRNQKQRDFFKSREDRFEDLPSFNEDRRQFKPEKRQFKEDRGSFREDRGSFREARKPYKKEDRSFNRTSTYTPGNSKGPRISKDSETVVNPVHLRKRKNKPFNPGK
ncbi:MAG: RNA methyltransferase [Muribaculaceae bacterium]|nr:RNA methyltransferase [Muribaculaceae bacterium]